MTRKRKFLVTLNNEHSAMFSRWNDAIIYAQWYTEKYAGTFVEVRDKTGILAQFEFGKLTPEFMHVEQNND